MSFRAVNFMKSASEFDGCPPPTQPEVAFIGRSNAGKSSVINSICGRKIAKVSSTPGKTTLLNFFEINEKFRIVDLPGYGYASRSKTDRKSWQPMIEEYLSDRENLVGLFLVMDIRRSWTDDEAQLVDWLAIHERPVFLILNKSDKLKKNEIARQVAKIQKASGAQEILITSVLERSGVDEVRKKIMELV
jgi:GTP-binding protein